MPHTIPHPARPRLARPSGTPPAQPTPGPDTQALAGYPDMEEPGFGGAGLPTAGRPGDAGAG